MEKMRLFWIIKCMGMALLLAGCSAYGAAQSKCYLQKSSQLRLLWMCAEQIRCEIRFHSLTIEECFKQLSRNAAPPFDALFDGTFRRLEDGMPLSGAWEEGIRYLETHTLLTKEDIRAFSDWVLRGGQAEKESQDALLSFCIGQLQEREKEAYSQYKSKEKVYRSLGICLGVFGCILLF